MDLAFSTLEMGCVALSDGIARAIVVDAEANWLEGAFLVNAVIGVAFCFFRMSGVATRYATEV